MNPQCSNSAKNKQSWKDLILSYLPPWFRAKPLCQIAAASSSRSCLPKETGTCIARGTSEKSCSKKCSRERVLKKYNFEEADVSEHSVAKRNSFCHICNLKLSSATDACQESLLSQAWNYLQTIVAEHRSDCARCNRWRSSNNIQQTASLDSTCCKKPLFQKVLAYFIKILSKHKKGCEQCKQRRSCPNLKETTLLETMLEQAWACMGIWSYIKKLSYDHKDCFQQYMLHGGPAMCKRGSATASEKKYCQNSQETTMPISYTHPCVKTSDKSCCQHCSEKRIPVCCKHSIKYPSSRTTLNCSDSLEKYAQQQSCPADKKERDCQSCPKLGIVKSLLSFKKPVRRCKSEDEKAIPGSPCGGLSMCIKQSGVMTVCTVSPKQSLNSAKLANDRPRTPPCVRLPSNPCNKTACDILGHHGSIQCLQRLHTAAKSSNASCKSNPNRCSTLPNELKKCNRPDCKPSKKKDDVACSALHSVQSCGPSSGTGTCKKPSPPPACPGPAPPRCPGSPPARPRICSKCSSLAAAPCLVSGSNEKKHMVDAECEAFSRDKCGMVLMARQLLGKENVCRDGCDCMTCVGGLLPPKKEPAADPNRYRYFY